MRPLDRISVSVQPCILYVLYVCVMANAYNRHNSSEWVFEWKGFTAKKLTLNTQIILYVMLASITKKWLKYSVQSCFFGGTYLLCTISNCYCCWWWYICMPNVTSLYCMNIMNKCVLIRNAVKYHTRGNIPFVIKWLCLFYWLYKLCIVFKSMAK